MGTTIEVEEGPVNHFEEIMTEDNSERGQDIDRITSLIPRTVAREDNENLTKTIILQEVEEVMQQMDQGKAPGSNGFTANFFHHFWDMIKEEVSAKIWWWWCNYKQEPLSMLWHIKYASGWLASQLVRFCGVSQGSHIWQKVRDGRRLIQEHRFWEILANFWDDLWNQQPKLGEDPRWLHIRIKCLEEGKKKVN